MKPDFMDRIEKIIAEMRTSTCIDDVDAEIIEKILQDALNEYYDALNKYYDGDIDNAYEEGYALGYDDGYAGGYYAGNSDGNFEGYDKGYDDGYDDGKMQTLTGVNHERVQH